MSLGVDDINGGDGSGDYNAIEGGKNVEIVADCQFDVFDGKGDFISDNVGDVGVEDDRNDDGSDSDGG